MPTGVYPRTKKHSFNLGRKHPNRKRYSRGITPINKTCLFCKTPFVTDCFQPRKKYCSQSCRSKNNPNSGMTGKKGSEKQREIMRNRKGELHPAWVADRTLLVDEHKDRGGQLHRDWSRQVKNRDNWECRMSNQECVGRMESHHVLSWKDYPELRYEINNGITLCHYHHPRKREDEVKLIPTFQKILKSL